MKKTNKQAHIILTILLVMVMAVTGAGPAFAWEINTIDKAAATRESSTAGDQGAVLPSVPVEKSRVLDLNGESALIMDMTTGTVIYEKKADTIREPASLTKVLNALVVLETLDLEQEVKIPKGIEISGTNIGLVPGEKLTVEQLLYGMLLPSGNDAAEALAIAAGGNLENFARMMNERARECGAEHTDYKSPNGLNEDPDLLNYTTARDLALISREAMQNPEFRKIVSTARYTIPATNKSDKRKLVNSNECLWRKAKLTVDGKKRPRKYRGCNGIKTGFTSDAGYCFVGSAKRRNTEFLVVTLKTDGFESRCRDPIKMWDHAFKKYETRNVLKAGQIVGERRVWGGTKRNVAVGLQETVPLTIKKKSAGDLTKEYRIDEGRAQAPVEKGERMGQALVYDSEGRLIAVQGLHAMASVGEGTPLSRIGIADEDLPLAGALAGAALLLIILICSAIRGRRRRARC